MRNITKDSAKALRNLKRFSRGNTAVTTDETDAKLKLHGHVVAEHLEADSALVVRDAGWRTNVTKERINGVLQEFATGLGVFQKDFAWYVSDRRTGTVAAWTGSLLIEAVFTDDGSVSWGSSYRPAVCA